MFCRVDVPFTDAVSGSHLNVSEDPSFLLSSPHTLHVSSYKSFRTLS
jgi:hypothetical protein